MNIMKMFRSNSELKSNGKDESKYANLERKFELKNVMMDSCLMHYPSTLLYQK